MSKETQPVIVDCYGLSQKNETKATIESLKDKVKPMNTNFKRLEATQRAHHVESMSIRRGYYVDTSKSKFRRISTSFPRTFSM